LWISGTVGCGQPWQITVTARLFACGTHPEFSNRLVMKMLPKTAICLLVTLVRSLTNDKPHKQNHWLETGD
jgi:hypothetical protein